MKITAPDVISNSYFPVLAAIELGYFKDEGLDMTFEHIVPVDKCYEALRDGQIDFVGGSSHSALAAFPGWRGVKLLGALAHGMYWFLVLRADLGAKKGDIDAVKGLRVGAAPWVEMGLRQLLEDAGIDLKNDGVQIAPIPGAIKPGVSFGVTAAQALADGKIDAFWANGMGAETAVRRGVGTVVVDARRGDGPKAAFNYTWPVLATSERLINENPDAVAAAVRALVKTQKALKADVSLATKVGRSLFPPHDAGMIADVVERDLPFYDPSLPQDFVKEMNLFTIGLGLLKEDVPYDQVVATEFSPLWRD
ncbi:MAG: ABC transporter substrate-binding protein [Proteobacteria bacterium]|nr:ABC transporter substrate-binding protein [Pseudomonadota bacterium]